MSSEVDTNTPECRQLKRTLAAAFRIIARRRLDDGIAGHISVRVPGTTDQFWVNPLGLLFEEITADDLLRIDHSGNIVEGKHDMYNQAGFAIHSEIHKARPDVVAICHTHAPKGTAFCPEPTADFLPSCWRPGELIRQRCQMAGEGAEECEARAVRARHEHIIAALPGHLTVPGAQVGDWLDSNQCRDCFLPTFNYRSASSV